MSLDTIPLTLAASTADEIVISQRSDQLVGYVESALLSTFSRRQARKRLQSFGLSRVTAESVLGWIEAQDSVRRNLAAKYRERLVLFSMGLGASIVVSFIPAVRTVFVGAIAVCLVSAFFCLLGWRKYQQPVFSR
jgi:hypothetical protein